MDRLTGNLLFVRVVESGSFTKAANELGVTQPTATKTIAALEEKLGARLLNRNTRGVSPTEIGALYYDKCKAIQRQIEEADSLPALLRSRVAGRLRISTSIAFGRRVLTPLLLRFMTEHPELSVDLNADDRYADLVAQGIDVAVRMGRLADSSLGARFLGNNPWVMVASPAYLQRAGVPRKLTDLGAHSCLVYSSVQGDDVWHITDPKGQAHATPIRSRLRSNNLSALLSAACRDFGLAILPRYVAHAALQRRLISEVLADHALPAQQIHAVFPSPKLVPDRVRALTEYLAGHFDGQWWARPILQMAGGEE